MFIINILFLFTKLITMSLVPNGVLLDPFCGLGAFVVSSVLNGMNFLTTEIDSKFFNLAKRRVSNAFRLGYDDRTLLFD